MGESKIRKILCSRVAVFLLLLAFIWLGLVAVRAAYKRYQLDREISNLKSEIAKTEQRGQELSQLLQYFGSNDYLEKEAKDKLNLKKEGESVVIVNEAAISAQIAEDNVAADNQSQPSVVWENNFVKWWKFFFKR